MGRVRHRCAVLGSPIAHSLSPMLHQAAYRSLGLDDWDYGRYDVTENVLPAWLRSRDVTWRGISLTMPLKMAVMPYGMPCDIWSERLRVANTAVWDCFCDDDRGDVGRDVIHSDQSANSTLRLYNTDVYGIAQAFAETGAVRVEDGARALIIGNGNTAASAMAACVSMGMRDVVLAARRPQAHAQWESVFPELRVTRIGWDAVAAATREASLVISTVPAHAADDIAELMVPARAGVPLLDVVYDPHPSKLLAAWRARGGVGIGGERMLLHQAIAQVELMVDIPSLGLSDDNNRAWRMAMNNAVEEAW